MAPKLSTVDLPNQSLEYFIHKISNLLTLEECTAIIQQQESSLIPTSAALSSRLRYIFDSEDLAHLLWERLSPFYGNTIITDEEQYTWKAVHLNTRFRFCKYSPSDAFGPHTDGRRLETLNTQSFMTVNMYLNTVPRSHGGATRVLDPRIPGDGAEKHKVLCLVQPELGSASVFRDSLFHDGEELSAGVKYLLRSNIMFEREKEFDFEGLYSELSSQDRGAKALEIAQRLEDGGNGDDAIRWYKKAFKLNPGLEVGDGL